jgi:hypothetical protein
MGGEGMIKCVRYWHVFQYYDDSIVCTIIFHMISRGCHVVKLPYRDGCKGKTLLELEETHSGNGKG